MKKKLCIGLWLLLLISVAVTAQEDNSSDGNDGVGDANPTPGVPFVTKNGAVLVAGTGVSANDVPKTFNITGEPYYLLNKSPMFQRVVHANIFKHGNYTLGKTLFRGFAANPLTTPSEAAKTIAAKLAELKPTYVRGLIRLDSSSIIFGSQVTDFSYIKTTVQQTVPGCKFDIEIEAIQFAKDTGQRLLNLLKYIKGFIDVNDNFKPDAIFFDHWNQAYALSPQGMSLAARYVHETMKLAVGGNCYGGSVPPHTDYVGIVTNNFKFTPVTTPFNIPVIGAISNSAANDMASEPCAFAGYILFIKKAPNQWDSQNAQSRAGLIKSWAEGQKSGGYSLSYPIWYPQCPGLRSVDAVFDGNFESIKNNLGSYNSLTSDVAAYDLPLNPNRPTGKAVDEDNKPRLIDNHATTHSMSFYLLVFVLVIQFLL